MNGRDLLEAMSFLDEELIARSEPKPRSFRWQWAAALAACFCAVLLGSFCLNRLSSDKRTPLESAQFALTMDTDAKDRLCEEDAGSGTATAETACAAEILSARIRVEAITEDGFRGTALEASPHWQEGTALTVVYTDTEALIPGEEYRIEIETFDPETLCVTIHSIEPEHADS